MSGKRVKTEIDVCGNDEGRADQGVQEGQADQGVQEGQEEVGGDRQEEREEEHEEFGKRETVRMQDPVKPSNDEIDDHNKLHLPFRSWCRHCVRGRAKNRAHMKEVKGKPGQNELHFDYCFLGREGEPGRTITVLAVKERVSGMLMAASVPKKPTGKYISRMVIAFM